MSNPVTQEDSNTSVQREWFDGEWFQPDSNLRWRWIKLGTDPRKIVLNPRFPDTLQKLQNHFSLLLGLVDSYTALDNLARDGVVKCVNWMEAFEYIVRFDKIPYPGRPGSDHYIDIITIWRDYMAHTQKKVIFAPDFTLWDKYAREFETLAISAIKQSERALDTYNKTLDSEIEEGIYIRVRQLQDWINTDLKDTRARDDYKKWKEEKESLSTTPQLRRRKNRTIEAAPITATSSYQSSNPALDLGYIKISSRRQRWTLGLQDDLTIWIFSLIVYFSCAVIQTISFARTSTSPPSSADYLSSLQTTLTQVLSVYITYILSDHSTFTHNSNNSSSTSSNSKNNTKSLGTRLRVWVIGAAILPVVAMVVLRWSVGMNGLLSFVGTAVNGFLQVMLAVHVKGASRLP